MTRPDPTAAPVFADLPPRREPRTSFTVELATVTPIFGGSYRTRALDDIDVIRAPTIRGHLRFWWRALYAHEHPTSRELYKAEAQLWGGPGGPGNAPARRSPVEIAVVVDPTREGVVDDNDIDLREVSGYGLFPARREMSHGEVVKETTPRRNRVAFTLTVTASVDELGLAAIRNSLRAWILFGGYGGRTRRGLGSVTVVGKDAEQWLPRPGEPLRTELAGLFGRDLFADGVLARHVPALGGAALCTTALQRDARSAWLMALKELREFRQGVPPTSRSGADTSPGAASRWARQPGFAPQPDRPSISNWPEADKIRHLAARGRLPWPFTHATRHNPVPVWPRAGFGLPIIGQFQTEPRRRNDPRYNEPGRFKLKWRALKAAKPRERLASALIVKAMGMLGGGFVGIALWLNREWPAGEIVLEMNGAVVAGSAAPFDALVPAGETSMFLALAGKPSLQTAFFDWLINERKWSNPLRAPSNRSGGVP